MKNYNYLILLFVLLLSFNLTAQQNSEEVTAASRTAEKLNEASNSTTIISEKEISSKKSFNVLSLLEGTVGVNVSRQGVNSFNVSLREGVDVFSTRTVLLSDGRELNTYGLNFFDASASTLSGLDIARVEVVRGSSSAVYGLGASSGVISFTTKNPFDYAGTTIQVSSGGITKFGGSILAGSAKNVQSNWNLLDVNFRHADHNEDKSFGYKINARYSENSDWLVGDQTSQALGGELPVMHSFNFDTSLYWRGEDFDLTTTFGLNDTENISRRKMWGEEKRGVSSKFLNVKLDSGNFFAQYNYVQNDTKENYNYWIGADHGIDSQQSHFQLGYELSLPSLSTELNFGADNRLIKFDTGGRVFGSYEDEDDFRTVGAFVSSKTNLFDNVDVLFQGRYDHFNVINEGAFSPKGVIFVKDNTGGTLRLSMSQSNNPDDAYTLFSDFSAQSLGSNGSYMGPYGNKRALTFNNPTWKPWSNLEGFVALHPTPRLDILGISHFHVMMGIAQGYATSVLTQAITTGNLFLAAPLSDLGGIAMDMLSGSRYTDFYFHDGNGNPMDLKGSDTSQLSTETTYELGYSNTIGDKFSYSVDVYNIKKNNIVGMRQVTPHVAINPSLLASEFGNNLANLVYSRYRDLGFPAANAAAFANIHGSIAGQFAAGFAASVPSLGLVQADQSPNDIHRLYWSHYNFGEINYWGADIATNYEINSAASLYANYSFINQTEFTKEDVGDITSPDVYHLNIPKHRVKAGFVYNPDKGLNFGLSFRYQNSMNANTLNSGDSSLFWFDGFVPKRTVWDMNVGMPITPKTRIDLTVDNVLGKKYQTFVNMPMIGQQALFTLTHNF